MRRFLAPLAALGAVLAPMVSIAVGCANSPGPGEVHGPVYEFDGSASSTVDAGPTGDATSPGTHDGSVTDATAGEAAANDAAGGGDAGDASAGEPDDGGDAGEGIDAAGCTSPTAVLAGSSGLLVGATAVGVGAFATQTISGSALFAPALVTTSAGFEALVASDVDAGGGGALVGVGLTGTTWSSPVALGGSASAIDIPAVAALGTTLQAVYLSPQNLYFHAQFDGTSWDTGADKVQVGTAPQSFGPVRVSAAASATELVIAYEGNDAHLYAQSWTSSAGWQTAVEIGTGKVGTNLAPAIVALAGDTSDFLVVYAVSSTAVPPLNYLNYALRSSATKTWSAPALTNVAAYTPSAPSIAPMSGGRAIVGWRGGNGLPYTMEFSPTAAVAWSTPVALASVNVDAAPSLAAGTCGYDAVAALATNGAVTIADYTSGAWIPPTPIAGISGAAFAAIATGP